MKLIAVRRDDRFSPNSVEKDRLILEAACNNVCRHFEQQGEPCALRWVDEAELTTHDDADLYLSMARLPEALNILEGFEQQGRRVINSPRGVRNCQRSVLDKLMRENQLSTPLAYQEGQGEESPCWLKRGDASAQTEGDVVYCKNEQELEQAKQTFASRGISDYVVSAHVEGDLVKFYGVRGAEGFFFYCYPNENGSMKFGDERRNGKPHHYAFDVCKLREDVFRVADVTSADFFGGDVIVRPDGSYVMIDFNDWPSYSICREEAAEAIASRFAERMEIKVKE